MAVKLVSSSTLGVIADTYLYSLAQSIDGHAVIASDDSLRIFDVPRLETKRVVPKCNEGVTSVAVDARQQSLLTAGRDGLVKVWDSRSLAPTTTLREPKGVSIAAISCQAHYVAAGTESQAEGLGDVRVLVFDTRKPGQPLRTYGESHTDTVTDLCWHPTQQNILLSGSTDGLVSIFDVDQADEDDALKQVLNQRSAINHVGLFAEDQAYVLTMDEQFSVYGLDKTGSAEDEALPVATLGDLRPRLSCMYIVGLLQPSGAKMLAHGHNEKQILSLTAFDDQTLELGQTVELPGAHGEEVVRDVKFVSQDTILSCGEDGQVRCWQVTDALASVSIDEADDDDARKLKKALKKEKKERKEKRYAPY